MKEKFAKVTLPLIMQSPRKLLQLTVQASLVSFLLFTDESWPLVLPLLSHKYPIGIDICDLSL